MDKEEILSKSKIENKQGDEKALLDRQKSYVIGYEIATMLCVVMSMIESVVYDRDNLALWIVYSGTCFAVSLVGLIRSKKKFLWLPLIITGIVFVAFVVLYFI